MNQGIALTRVLLYMGITLAAHPSNTMAPRVSFEMSPSVRVHGIASWYSESDPFIQKLTASGEVFDDKKATCASWDFPLGAYVKVTNVQNGKSVICRVNDRGPERSLNRAIDLTKSSFQKIEDPRLGLVEVTITPIQIPLTI